MAEYEMWRGDTFELDLVVTRQDPVTKLYRPVNLAGAKLWITAKFNLEDTDDNAVFQASTTSGGIVITDAAAGKASIAVPATATIALTADESRLFYDIQLDSAGRIYTLERGTLIVNADVTRATS